MVRSVIALSRIIWLYSILVLFGFAGETNEWHVFLSKKQVFSGLLQELAKKGIKYHSIVDGDEETKYVRVEIREIHEEHTSLLETFYFDPKTKRCFVQDPVDLTLREIQ